MTYTHTFEFMFSGEHEHNWQGEVSFNHGQLVTIKFNEAVEFTAEEINKINNLFRTVQSLCSDCGVPTSVEIKLKPV